MEIMLFMAIGLGTIAVCVCIGHVEINCLAFAPCLKCTQNSNP